VASASFTTTFNLSFPLPLVFDFFCRPAQRITLALPELRLRLVEGPERLEKGSRLVVEGRSYGLTRRMVSEITGFEQDRLLTETQREGPFLSWEHRQEFASGEDGTRLTDTILYECPGGMLGLILKPERVESTVRAGFDYRNRLLLNLLADWREGGNR
jgi:ligand-binding SRPBCC domain-containing protein